MSSVLFWGLFKRTSWKTLLCSQSRCSDTAPRSEIPNCRDSSQHEHRVGGKTKLQKEVIFKYCRVTEMQNSLILYKHEGQRQIGKHKNKSQNTTMNREKTIGKPKPKQQITKHNHGNLCQKRRSGLLTIPPHRSLGLTD